MDSWDRKVEARNSVEALPNVDCYQANASYPITESRLLGNIMVLMVERYINAGYRGGANSGRRPLSTYGFTVTPLERI